jgi:hypothetical protein
MIHFGFKKKRKEKHTKTMLFWCMDKTIPLIPLHDHLQVFLFLMSFSLILAIFVNPEKKNIKRLY